MKYFSNISVKLLNRIIFTGVKNATDVWQKPVVNLKQQNKPVSKKSAIDHRSDSMIMKETTV